MKYKLIIVGAGFGGIFLAKKLAKYKHDVLIIDKQNHHLFQPLLYQVACGMLAPEDIASPIRRIFSKFKNIKFVNENIIGIDRNNRKISTNLNTYQYENLVLATGSKYHYFGNDHWQEYTYSLKSLADALDIKNHIYQLFERAISIADNKKRCKLLSFVIIGGGPTGVEMAGALADVFKKLVQNNQPLKYEDINITLLEGGPRLLLNMKDDLSEYTKKALEAKGVKVLLNTIVTDIQEGRVTAKDLTIDTDTIIWAAGVKASEINKLLGVELRRDSKVMITPYLNLSEDPNVYIIGDAAYLEQDSIPLPALAAVAKQQGDYLGNRFLKMEKNHYQVKQFRYKDLGTLATIGKNAAVATIENFSFTGFPAWLFWSFIHLLLLISFRNKFQVFISWFLVYILDKVDSQIIIINKNN